MLDVQERTLGRDHVDTANILQNLACVYRDWGRNDQARTLFEEVIRIHEAAYVPNHPRALSNLEDYLELLRQTDDDQKAAEIEARIRAIRGK